MKRPTRKQIEGANPIMSPSVKARLKVQTGIDFDKKPHKVEHARQRSKS